MDKIISFNDQELKVKEEEEEQEFEEEAISLCDFPLNYDEAEKKASSSSTSSHHRSSPSQSPDIFEFFNNLNSDNNINMSHAEDIISFGKLVPYKNQILKSNDLSRRYCGEHYTKISFEELNHTRVLTRSSRSLDCKRLRRNSDNIHRSSSENGLEKLSERRIKGWKPRRGDWAVFGPAVKFPMEIDLRDMRNRQVRRNLGTGEKSPGSSWGEDLLRVLSCKSHASVAIGLVPQV